MCMYVIRNHKIIRLSSVFASHIGLRFGSALGLGLWLALGLVIAFRGYCGIAEYGCGMRKIPGIAQYFCKIAYTLRLTLTLTTYPNSNLNAIPILRLRNALNCAIQNKITLTPTKAGNILL